MTDKKKHKPQTFKSMHKSEDMIIRVDEKTFYHKRTTEPDKDPYMIYKDLDDRWLCDCADFWVHLPDKGKAITHKCKHILRIKKEFNIA